MLLCQNSLPPLCPQPRGDENPFPKAKGPQYRFMAAERFLPTAVSGGCLLSLFFVFTSQDFEMLSENVCHVLFAARLIITGPFCSFSDQLDMKRDGELGALSLSLCDD